MNRSNCIKRQLEILFDAVKNREIVYQAEGIRRLMDAWSLSTGLGRHVHGN